MSGLAIAAIRMLCPDPWRSAAFYAAAFDAAPVQASGAALALGEQRLAFSATAGPAGDLAPSNETAFQHCAIIVADMAAAAHLRTIAGWTAISRAGPETLPASSGGVSAFKFRDPDGHPLELLSFPAGAAPPAWRDRPGLFLGIDHTAITVTDTARSVAFWRALGFTVASRGVNRGPEQARMDDVAAPVVEVTGLLPPGGAPPHLELLCYREPGTIVRPLADDDRLATRIVLRGGGAVVREGADPDGHRFVVG